MTTTTDIRIPFNRPSLTGNELAYIEQAVLSGHTAGDGQFTKKCQAMLEGLLGTPRVLLTSSCTDALEMCALLVDPQPGDEVICPSFTFSSTANAFALRGARVVFGDIRPDTLNLDEQRLERLITSRTRAIAVVHYGGVACEMDTINEIAQRHHIPVVEDNAHGLFGKYKGRWLGGLGALATQSFHETKNFGCGEGGALLINDPQHVERAEIIREKGTDRSKFYRGQVDKYTWVDIGSSFLPSDIIAAYLYAQLEQYQAIQQKRQSIWQAYYDGLADWACRLGVARPSVPEHCDQAYHLFYLLMPTEAERDALMEHLRQHGILSVFHYLPLHLSKMGETFGAAAGDCPVTESVSGRLLRLPFYNDLTVEQQGAVIDAVRSFEPQRVA